RPVSPMARAVEQPVAAVLDDMYTAALAVVNNDGVRGSSGEVVDRRIKRNGRKDRRLRGKSGVSDGKSHYPGIFKPSHVFGAVLTCAPDRENAVAEKRLCGNRVPPAAEV